MDAGDRDKTMGVWNSHALTGVVTGLGSSGAARRVRRASTLRERGLVKIGQVHGQQARGG
jgi:hypothetical protein